MSAPATFEPASGTAGLDPAALFGRCLAAQSAVIAAVSGGSDSLALLFLLDEYRRSAAPSLSVTVVTVDHALRPESAGEARRVATLAARMGLAHRTLRWDGPKPRTGLIAAAREARYRLLALAAREAGAAVVLTAHTADDQAETVSMRAARGGGEGRGLAGMAPLTLFEGRTWIARPLLGLGRERLRAYLRGQGIAWAEDPTNSDPRFERARLRLVSPRSAAETEALLRLAQATARRREATAERAAALIRRHADRPAPGLLRLAPAFSEDGDRPAALLALRFLLATAGGRVHPVEELRAEALLDALAAARRRSLGGAIAERRRDAIFLRRELRGIPDLVPEDGGNFDNRFRIVACHAPLCPAGHLPHEGGDQARRRWQPISPLVGEMPGRAEGGVTGTTMLAAQTATPVPGAPTLLAEAVVAPWGAAWHPSLSEDLPGVPPSLARAAAATQPVVRLPDSRKIPLAEAGLRAEPVVAPFMRFLPGFDLPLAEALHELVGAAPLPSPPFAWGAMEQP